MERTLNQKTLEITLIQEPPYRVDFAQFLSVEKSNVSDLHQRIRFVFITAVGFLGILSRSLFQAGYVTCKHMFSSFGYVVLDTFKTTDFYLAGFKVAYWAFSIGFTFVSTATHKVIGAYSSSKSNELLLSQFVHRGINPSHIQTKEIQLDTSDVPTNIKVAGLLTLFDQINFDNPIASGYMIPSTRRGYAVEDLKKHLKTFVNNINGRVPFLGTPPAHDIVHLHTFYQQIEDAVRLSLHQVIGDLERFHGEHPHLSDEGEIVKKEYDSLLANQARLVIDLAIAGAYCGARYMGEATDSYNCFCKGESKLSDTLQETLLELLTTKRKEIANEEIAKHFGQNTQSVHGYGRYMQCLGNILAIPGTENIIEYLSSGDFDYNYYLNSFFSRYDENYILKAVQEKVKTSQSFREQIIDWLKERVEDWNPGNFPSAANVTERMEQVISDNTITPSEEDISDIDFFIKMIFNLKDRTVHCIGKEECFPDLSGGWPEFLDRLFILDEIKQALKEHYSGLSPIELIKKRQELIEKIGQGDLGKALERRYVFLLTKMETGMNEGLNPFDEELDTLLLQLEKVRRMREILPVNKETLLRVLRGKERLGSVIQDYLKQPLREQFIEALNFGRVLREDEEVTIEGGVLGRMAKEGLSLILMEWLLDFHGIFIPKETTAQIEYDEIRIDPRYRNIIDPNEYIAQMQTENPNIVQSSLISWIKQEYATLEEGKRYVFGGSQSEIHEVALRIFESAFQDKEEELTSLAENMLPGLKPFYPRWKSILYIEVPKKGAAVLKSPFFQLILLVSLIYKSVKVMNKAYELSMVWADRIHDYCTQEASLQIEAYRYAWKIHQWFSKNKRNLFLSLCIIRLMLALIPYHLSHRFAQFIPLGVLGREEESYYTLLFRMIMTPLRFGRQASNAISSMLQYQANRAEQERSIIRKRYCCSIWNRLITVR